MNNKKIGFVISGCLVMFALVLLATDATLSTTRPQTEDNQMQVDKRNAMSTAGLYEALAGKGPNAITTTNRLDLTILAALNSLSNRIEQVFDTNSAALGTNGLRTIPAGYVPANNAINTVNIQEALSSTYGGDGSWELLSAVSTNTIGTWYDVSRYNSFTFTMCPPTTGAAPTNENIFTDISLNSGTNFYCIATNNFTTTNVQMLKLAGKYKYIRMRIDTTNLVYSARGFAGYE